MRGRGGRNGVHGSVSRNTSDVPPAKVGCFMKQAGTRGVPFPDPPPSRYSSLWKYSQRPVRPPGPPAMDSWEGVGAGLG